LAITTTYSWQFVSNIDLDFVTSATDVTSLANGGFAGLGTHSSHIDGTIFDSNGTRTDGWTSTQGSNGALDQLSNGNIVIASTDADNTTLFKIVDGVTGNEVVATFDFADADQSEVDVAALTGGGFWVVATDEIGAVGGNSDIDVFIRNNDGSSAGSFTVDVTTARDVGASVAGLDGGGAVVAWTREVGAETEVWYAVYNSAGGVVKAPALFDTTGTVNRNVSVTAMNGGGFAIAYEDNGWGTGSNDITLAQFNSAGTFQRWDNVSSPTFVNDGSDDANPYVTRLSNGMLAVAYGDNAFADTDTYVRLFDPATNTVVATRTVTGGENVKDDTDFASIAGFGLGRLAVFHTNLTGGDVDGEDLQAVRTTVGDAANDVFFGDELVDVINGNGGEDNLAGGANNDTINGGANDDILRGDAGDDIIDGGAGADSISGGSGDDDMAGGTQNDTYLVDSGGDTITELLNQGTDVVRTALLNYSLFFIANVEEIHFTGAGNFVGRGNALDNRILGGLGNDRFVVDQGGADRYFGDTGVSDTVDYRISAASATVNLTTGVHGGAAAGDFFSSIEYFFGSDTAGDNFTSAAFNDHFFGYAGADTLLGVGGNDYLYGGEGDDEISGGALLDFLYGENGADDFNYTALTDSGPTSGARDRIYDFVAGSDDIDVSAIDASATLGGNNAFTQFLGAGAFTGESQVRWYQSGANTVIEFNTTGASGAEMQIQLQNFTAASLAAADFIA
jgi:hypothetical protein